MFQKVEAATENMPWGCVCVCVCGCSHYEDVCSLLDALFPTDRYCPRVLRRHAVRCRCPFHAGLVDLARLSFRLPRFNGFMRTLAVVSSDYRAFWNVSSAGWQVTLSAAWRSGQRRSA